MRPDDEAPDGGYVNNSKQSHAVIPPQLVPFTKGDDPRRWKGGPIAKQIAAARDALSVHLPDAVKAFGELVHSTDDRIRLAAAAEICDRTIGRPKPIDADTEGAVRNELSIVFQRLREKLEPEAYKILLAEIAENAK